MSEPTTLSLSPSLQILGSGAGMVDTQRTLLATEDFVHFRRGFLLYINDNLRQ